MKPNPKLLRTLIYSSLLPPSSYPSKRVMQDKDGVDLGVAGTISLLQNVTLSTQPICGFDWSPDKTGLAMYAVWIFLFDWCACNIFYIKTAMTCCHKTIRHSCL